MPDHPHHLRHPEGFAHGYTPITRPGEPTADTGIEFGILVLRPGEIYDCPADLEAAFLLMRGEVSFAFDGSEQTARRASLFDDDPIAIHFSMGARVRLTAQTEAELAVLRTQNDAPFATKLFDARSMLEPSEHRDRDLLEGTSHRIVRTIFDLRNRPEARLVLGEVITFPGRWSSYPPHHHPQPEIYHYRFSQPQGFGHGELGESVRRIKQYDTVKILDLNDHSQVAAPGYAMWYLWVIRHLPGNPYTVPEFTAEHRWLKDPNAKVWKPPT